ncbi:MAG TPA: SDR family oxidoreductase [Anaerolineaceae bacterium]|nr:SDR family oxidoreductase [Anaerolineaceae bacterium]HPN53333.1 SDR family oxidoreductase [Anaerolineaceae bacterium]
MTANKPVPQRILITGVSGLLGINLALEAVKQGREVVGLANSRTLQNTPFAVRACDLTDLSVIHPLLDELRPNAVVHCAALANLEVCESQPDLAQRLNTETPGRLAAETARRHIPFVHISTDAVFNGASCNYLETDPVSPLSIYARTKAEAEKAVLEAHPDALVARVNFYGWSLSGQRSLAEWFFNNLSGKRQVKGFTDVFFCPMLVNDLAGILLRLLDLHAGGIYHVVGSECLSKYAFGVAVARAFDLDENLITPVTAETGGLVARRSPNMCLNTEKLARTLGGPPPGLASGMERFTRLYREGYPETLRAFNQPGS